MKLILGILRFIAASFSQLLSGLAAVPFWFFIFRAIQEPQGLSEILIEPKGWLVILSTPFIAIAFTAYAIGGQKLLRKVAPKLAEKKSEDSVN